MIKINLLGEKADNSLNHALQVLGFGSSVVLSLALCFFLQESLSNEVQQQEKQKIALNKELEELKKTTKQVNELEQKKKTLKEKLFTIATLKAKKQGPVRVLDDINKATPERAWLLGMKEKDGTMQIDGIALDNQTIATFMNDLGRSEFLGTIDLIKSEQTFLNDVKVKQFAISAQLKNPLELQKPVDGAVPNAVPGKTPEKRARLGIISEAKSEVAR